MAARDASRHRRSMITVRIDNTVHDYNQWKAAFDDYAAMRGRLGVLEYRIARPTGDDHRVLVELDFRQRPAAEAFIAFLVDKVWRTPRSQANLTDHQPPELFEVLERTSTAGERWTG
jgi:hypothetical protein